MSEMKQWISFTDQLDKDCELVAEIGGVGATGYSEDNLIFRTDDPEGAVINKDQARQLRDWLNQYLGE